MAATLRRLKRLATQWPVDTSRPGRDLGEHIRNWANPMKEGDWKDTKELEQAYEALKLIQSNHFRKKYPREKEIAFTGTLAKDNPWLLSNDVQDKMQKRSVWDRLLGRKTSI